MEVLSQLKIYFNLQVYYLCAKELVDCTQIFILFILILYFNFIIFNKLIDKYYLFLHIS